MKRKSRKISKAKGSKSRSKTPTKPTTRKPSKPTRRETRKKRPRSKGRGRRRAGARSRLRVVTLSKYNLAQQENKSRRVKLEARLTARREKLLDTFTRRRARILARTSRGSDVQRRELRELAEQRRELLRGHTLYSRELRLREQTRAAENLAESKRFKVPPPSQFVVTTRKKKRPPKKERRKETDRKPPKLRQTKPKRRKSGRAYRGVRVQFVKRYISGGKALDLTLERVYRFETRGRFVMLTYDSAVQRAEEIVQEISIDLEEDDFGSTSLVSWELITDEDWSRPRRQLKKRLHK